MTWVSIYFLAAIALALAPKFVAAYGMIRAEGYDNDHPRHQQARQEGWVARALAAHANGMEALVPFGVGLLVAQGAGAVDTLLVAGGVFVASRVLYIAMYLAGWGTVRTLVWSVGFGASVWLILTPLTGAG